VSEKAKISKEAANALELMRAKGAPLNEIVERHINHDHIRVNGWGNVEQLPTDTLIRALYIGFEVQQTPEEIIKGAFEHAIEQLDKLGDHPQAEHWKGMKYGIIITLGALGIKIKGVNAE
jgi:hypothetical protein